MKFEIIHLQNPAHEKILRTPSIDVAEFNTPELREFCANLVETMLAEKNGVGLAAPQVGRNLNIFVVRTEEGMANKTDDYLILINPYTVIAANDPQYAIEGCLSIPGILGKVLRFRDIGCIYYDIEGKRHKTAFTGFPARMYQHEFDHLCGTLFIDRAEAFYRPKE